MSDDAQSVAERFSLEHKRMEEVFLKLERTENGKAADEFLSMAKNYFKDSEYFFGQGDAVRAFEAVVISWAYVDAGIKAGFFSVPDGLKEYFTS